MAVTPVLILDQFEEFFTLGKHHAQREELRDELYWLIEDQVPEFFQQKMLDASTVSPYTRQAAEVKVMIVVREDYLPHLLALKTRIHIIDRVVFRLTPLNGVQAREVIGMAGEGFLDTQQVHIIIRVFYPETVGVQEQVVDTKLEVEPVLLEEILVCPIKDKLGKCA